MHFGRMTGSQSPSKTLRGDRPNLRDLDPSPLGQRCLRQLQSKGEGSFGLRAGQRNDNDCSGPVVEGRAAENKDWPPARLLVADRWIKVSPINVSSQLRCHAAAVESREAHDFGEEALGEFLFRGAEDFSRGPGFEDFAGGDEGDLVGDGAGETHLVGA